MSAAVSLTPAEQVAPTERPSALERVHDWLEAEQADNRRLRAEVMRLEREKALLLGANSSMREELSRVRGELAAREFERWSSTQ